MASRLSRIIDRGRTLAEGVKESTSMSTDLLDFELNNLERRRHFTSVAITASTISALLVCIDIAALFIEALLNAPFKWVIGALFISAMLVLVIGLAFFLREVHLAMQSIRITKFNNT
jgi:hypothetical protein